MHTTTAALVVQPSSSANFSLAVSPTTQAVDVGNPTTYSVTISRTGDSCGSVSFSTSGLPSGATRFASARTRPVASSALTVNTQCADTGRQLHLHDHRGIGEPQPLGLDDACRPVELCAQRVAGDPNSDRRCNDHVHGRCHAIRWLRGARQPQRQRPSGRARRARSRRTLRMRHRS